MRVVYVLNGTALYGGVKVVFQHADILRRMGIDAEVVSPEPAPHWYPGSEAFHRHLTEMTPEAIGPSDIAVGTIYYTVPIAATVPHAIPVHLVQSWERGYAPIRDQWDLIDEIYRRPTVKIAVSPHLVELIKRTYHQDCAWIPQPLDTRLFSPGRGQPRAAVLHGERFRVLVSGRWDLEVKGVERAMRALRPLVNEGLELVRLTQVVVDEERAFWPEAENHVAIAPVKVPDVLRSVDAYVTLSSDVEGFGLPMLEAMSCGVPAVVSDIGSHRAMDPHSAATLRVPVEDADTLRSAVRKLRDDAELRARLGREGRRIAETFSEERTGRALMDAFSARTRVDAAATDEVLRRVLSAVDPPPHLRNLRPLQHLGHRVSGQIADDILLVVILATEDALAVRRDVEMLQRAGANVLAAGEALALLFWLDADVEPSRAIHDHVLFDFEPAAAVPRVDGFEVLRVHVVSGAEDDDFHFAGEGAVFEGVDVAHDHGQMIGAAVVLVTLAIERRQIDAEIAKLARLHDRVDFRGR